MEEQFRQLESTWMNAWIAKDQETLNNILSDDFILVSSIGAGTLMDKKEWLEKAVSLYHCTLFEIDQIQVKNYGDTAVVYLWSHQEAEANGRPWNGNFLCTDVWVKQNSGWKVVSRHGSWLQ